MKYLRTSYLLAIILALLFKWNGWEVTIPHLQYATMVYLFLVIPMVVISQRKLGGHEAQPELNYYLASTAWAYVAAQLFQITGCPSFSLAGLALMGGYISGAFYIYIEIYFHE